MPEFKATLSFEIDGIPLPDMPVVRRYVVPETALFELVATPDNGSVTYHPIAAAIMSSLGIFYVTNDQAYNLKLNLNNPLPMNAGGLVLILGTALTQGTPNQNVEYNNPVLIGGVNVTLGGIVAGQT